MIESLLWPVTVFLLMVASEEEKLKDDLLMGADEETHN